MVSVMVYWSVNSFSIGTTSTDGTNRQIVSAWYSSVNTCSLLMVYRSTGYFSDWIDWINGTIRERLSSVNEMQFAHDILIDWGAGAPFVPMVQIVRLLWLMMIIYQWNHWWGCFDDWYLFVYIGHVWCCSLSLLVQITILEWWKIVEIGFW